MLFHFLLDEKVIYQLKSEKALSVNIRLIAATNRTLMEEVELKQFRDDLYYRLKESSLVISPLRERLDDILPLVRHFIEVYNQIYNKNVTGMSKEAENYFLNYPWKGNTRELKNTIKSIIPFKKNDTIHLDDLSYSIIEGDKTDKKQFSPLEEHEKNYIQNVLKAAGFNISRAAEILGTNRPRLYRKIKYYRLEETFQ